ncbi:MAG: hypothetical protein IOC82_12330 [Aestuariivirga sp.]|uniref:hypothetical protein n=1 Tax=Aestuariivirga sp. TaxID=2650926 RepID=UPI0025BF2416|nr:hypothetical protein [Aestuariivirga sp.]MCA3561805.1 hypothetical protein [Aestuariivirga sp.]
MAVEQLNIRPLFRATEVPCDGQVGDVLIVTPLSEKDIDPDKPGNVQVFICTRASNAETGPAIWSRLRFDGYTTCKSPLPNPVKDIPVLRGG